MVVLEQPKAVLILGGKGCPASGLVQHRTPVFGRHLPQPAIVGPHDPITRVPCWSTT
jgi:hypothetical protein